MSVEEIAELMSAQIEMYNSGGSADYAMSNLTDLIADLRKEADTPEQKVLKAVAASGFNFTIHEGKLT